MRRGVVLHLLARHEVVFARTLGRRAQLGLAHPARERAAGQPQVMLVSQDLAHARSQFDPSGRSTRRGLAP
jgi:hypothetical protein